VTSLEMLDPAYKTDLNAFAKVLWRANGEEDASVAGVVGHMSRGHFNLGAYSRATVKRASLYYALWRMIQDKPHPAIFVVPNSTAGTRAIDELKSITPVAWRKSFIRNRMELLGADKDRCALYHTYATARATLDQVVLRNQTIIVDMNTSSREGRLRAKHFLTMCNDRRWNDGRGWSAGRGWLVWAVPA